MFSYCMSTTTPSEWWCIGASLPRYCPPPLYALTEPAFTVQDVEELHQPMGSTLYTVSGLVPIPQEAQRKAAYGQSTHSFIIILGVFFVCFFYHQMDSPPPRVLGATLLCIAAWLLNAS